MSGRLRAGTADSTVGVMVCVFARVRCAVVVVGACCFSGCAPAPVQAFEKFYAATASRDVKGFRAALCTHTRATLSAVSDEALRRGMTVTKVVQKIEVVSVDDAGAVLDVTDATGGHERVQLQKEEGAWCVLLPEKP